MSLFAVALKVYEKIEVGPALQTVFGGYQSNVFEVMSRVVCHTMFFGRWQGEDVRVIADYDGKVRLCQDVSYEALSMYVSFNKQDKLAAKMIASMRASR